MKKNKFATELKHLNELLSICLDILEELQFAKTYHGVKKRERYEKRAKQIRKKIELLSSVSK